MPKTSSCTMPIWTPAPRPTSSPGRMPCCAADAAFFCTHPTGRFLASAFWRCAAAKGRAAAGRARGRLAPDPMPRRRPVRRTTTPAIAFPKTPIRRMLLPKNWPRSTPYWSAPAGCWRAKIFAPRAADSPDVDAAGQWANAREALPNSLGPLIRDLDWNEDLRLTDWLAVVDRLRGENMPAVMQAAIAWEAWQDIEPLQHQHWLGTLLVAALLRQTGKVGSHLFCLHAGLRIVPRDRRKSPLRTTRLLAALDAFAEAAAAGLKEHDRLVMGKGQMERRLRKRRKNSSLPALIELVLARPVVSAGLIAAELKISQRAALDLVAELGIREVTGRGRYRAWGFI